MLSEIGNCHAAQWAAVLPFANPLFDALCVEYVFLIAVKRSDEVVTQKVAPADGALTPEATHAVVRAGLFLE